MELQREFIAVRGVPTKVLKLNNNEKAKHMFLIIPGNPGMCGYYEDFMKEMRTNLLPQGVENPIWCVGHAGHEVPPAGAVLQLPPLRGNEELFDLDGQVRHKLAFIEEHLEEDVEITFVGHSIGCKIVLEVMRHFSPCNNRDTGRKFRGYLLFPTIQDMKVTPLGRKMWWQFAYLAPTMSSVVRIWNMFVPTSAKKFLIRKLAGMESPHLIDTTLQLLNQTAIRNIYHLAHTEMVQVLDLDVDLVKRFAERTRFYYGTKDSWCPLDYHRQVKSVLPESRVELCRREIPHAFVINNSRDMAETVTRWHSDDVTLDNLALTEDPN